MRVFDLNTWVWMCLFLVQPKQNQREVRNQGYNLVTTQHLANSEGL